MEPVGRPNMGVNANAPVAAPASVTSAVVGLLLSPTRPSAITTNPKYAELAHTGNHRAPAMQQHCAGTGGGSNVVQNHQYSPVLVAGRPPALPLVPPSLVHSARAGPLLPAPSSQIMLSTATTTSSGVISHFQQHNVGSHQLVAAPAVPAVSAAPPAAMATSNVTTAGMALSPFGILPHERVVPHNTHHRHQHHRKLPVPPSSKIPMNTNGAQILTSTAISAQRLYGELPQPPQPIHLNKMKPFDVVQLQQNNKIKTANSVPTDKNLPVVSSAYDPQTYEQRYQPRTPSQQVGYLSVITRTTNSVVMNEVTSPHINYYPTQPIPLQSKASDIQDRQYYHFDSTASASQTPQQQLDNILLMGSPVQRGDPMHIVKNLQSMQTDMDFYGVKKMIEQQPRLLTADNSKTIGSSTLSNNSSKSIVDHHHQHLQQMPKLAVIEPTSSYNGQYFNRRQPPPAHLHQHQNQPHLQQHMVSGNTKMLPTPTSLSVVSANGNIPLDVHYQRHLRWNLDQQKPPAVSTPSCFSGNISSGVFHQPPLQQLHQYNNAPSTFNVQQQIPQQISQPANHNNFVVSSINPTYYNPTTTIASPTVTSVTTTSSSLSLYNRPQHNNQPLQNANNFQDFANNSQGGNYISNGNDKQHVMVPDIEQELNHLCDKPTSSTNSTTIKPINTINQKPSFLDSYIKFLRGGASCTTVETEECHDKPKKLLRPISSTPKPMSKPYIPLQKPKIAPPVSEHVTPTRNVSVEDNKKNSNFTTTTTDDDPRYFPLPKTSSSIAGISDDKSDGSNGGNSWLSVDEDDPWWISSSKGPNSSTTIAVKNKVNVGNNIKKNNAKLKKTTTNSDKAYKKQKTQHTQQPRRQLSHRLAKDKTQKLLSSNINGELGLDDDELLSDPDSDVDPAWMPNSDDNDVANKNCDPITNRHFSHKKYSREQCLNSENTPSTSATVNNNNNDLPDDSNEIIPFKSGTFVALKNQYLESGQLVPQQLWRVDGKALLQKFELCNMNENVYKSVSIYTGWSPTHFDMYRQVTVQLVTTHNGVTVVQNKNSSSEILVQLLSDDDNTSTKNDPAINPIVGSLSNNHHIAVSKTDACHSVSSMKPSGCVDDQYVILRAKFEVYIQTLTSHALDSNFLVEIYHENDKYFLSNIDAIETVTQTWIQAIDSAIIKGLVTEINKVENIRTMIKRYPDMEMYATDESSVPNVQLNCIVCGYQGFVNAVRKFNGISLSGLEYNNRTLKTHENRPFSKIMPAKRVHCCSNAQCEEKASILHNLEHLKYKLYKECCKRVTTENNNSKDKVTQDSTTVLNRILADDEWIRNLFQMVCDSWDRAKAFLTKV